MLFSINQVYIKKSVHVLPVDQLIASANTVSSEIILSFSFYLIMLFEPFYLKPFNPSTH